MKKPKIKSIPYEDFIDNESLEKMVKELNEGGANVFVGVLCLLYTSDAADE